MDIEKKTLIFKICTAKSTAESYALYKLNRDYLKDCKFIFSSERGNSPGFSINRDFSDGSVIRGLFSSSKIVVLDNDTVKSMDGGNAIFQIDYSISLDTQALSYLEPFIDGRVSKIPDDFREVFSFIARDEVSVDPMPYMLENLVNLSDQKSANRIFQKIKAYEILRSLDSSCLESDGEIKSVFPECELLKKAQENISMMYQMFDDKAFMDGVMFGFYAMYWHLLTMIEIQLSNPKLSVQQKLYKFIKLCHWELSTLSLREIAIARVYFEKGQNLTFFGKIQIGQKKLFKVMEGMAWDLFHVRQLEKALTMRPLPTARYFFPAFLTCDKRLVEIIDIYPLKSCAYIEGENEPMPYYDGDFLELMSSDEGEQRKLCDEFFTEGAVISRAERRDDSKRAIKKIIERLEHKVSSISGAKNNSSLCVS